MRTNSKQYQIIYADPPWEYNSQGKSKVGDKSKKFRGTTYGQYPYMSLDDIKSLKIDRISDKNCALFLWITFPLLPWAFEVMQSWGFRYRTIGFVWIKQNKNKTPFFGIGHYTKSNSEICLLAIKGSMKVKSNKISQLIFSQREKHSKKPDIIRDKIVELFGDLPRIELFARKQNQLFDNFKGWDIWCNETKNDIEL